MAYPKNFKYGDIWQGKALENQKSIHGAFRADPEDYTTKSAFIGFFKKNKYSLYLDYDMDGFAYTDPSNKRVVLNANYPKKMLERLLQHEMGHILLFNASQFSTVTNDSMRSIIARNLYTSDSIHKYGMRHLFRAENIAQDVVIETFSNTCVCDVNYDLYEERAGVKHLDVIDSIAHITREVMDTYLKDKDKNSEDHSKESVLPLIDSLLDQLNKDIESIKLDQNNLKPKKDIYESLRDKNARQQREIENKIKRLDDLLERKPGNERAKSIVDKLQKRLEELQSKESEAFDHNKAEKLFNQRKKSLENKINRQEDLKKTLEEERANEAERDSQNSSSSSESKNQESESGESEKNSKERNGEEENDGELHGNYTDHLGGDDSSANNSSHSYDCGFPLPLSVELETNDLPGTIFKSVGQEKSKVRKIQIDDDDLIKDIPGKNKSSEYELTYRRPNKREILPSDMLQGKKKKRLSGINVLIGLDISGSMSKEWTDMFDELSDKISDIKEALDIEEVVYFTYNHELKDYSTDIDDLNPKASGGNSFPWVYQQIMENLPILQKNEIILITDCGDNLGFELNSVCEVSKNSMPVKNHVTVVDTENAAFYQKVDMFEEDWDMISYDDSNMFERIEDNLQNIIEKF